jgi:pimeloyl-ACP methyl ester carboxylesterase
LTRWLRALFGLCALGIVVVAAILAFFRLQAHERETHEAASIAPPSGRFVNAADVEIFVQEAGPADGPAVLFVHGTGAWSETWREAMAAAAGAGFRAIAIDLPPFGFSSRPANGAYAPADQGKRIIGVLDALQIPRAVLVGHSFGGGPTMEAVFDAPARIRALVAVDVALGIDAPAEASPVMSGLLGFSPLRDAVVATFLTNPAFTRRLLAAFVADAGAATPERVRIYQRPLAVRGSTRAIGEWLPVLIAPVGTPPSATSGPYRALALPALVIWGDLDTITPLPQGTALAKLIPGARLEVLTGVGHIPQIENPQRFNAVLVGFLAGLQPD